MHRHGERRAGRAGVGIFPACITIPVKPRRGRYIQTAKWTLPQQEPRKPQASSDRYAGRSRRRIKLAERMKERRERAELEASELEQRRLGARVRASVWVCSV